MSSARQAGDGGLGTATISGSVTANAGTNLNTSALALEEGGNLAALVAAINDYPTLGTPTVLPVSGTSAATEMPLAAGKYLLIPEVAVCWVQAESPTAVYGTDKLCPATVLPVTLAAQRLAAITAGASGKLYIIPVSTVS